ncbi:hypothetical protein VHEMI07684 [[Torrubiella] hemipterigena]|uniref:Uncharacterized protein n=1 Tax=[Torrubiella] hemipterigena TaxID=1531966 RepID=A0A0A1TM30_9HYPO|nr:hypothetical protein VHEMI07684 [[Torrubiella] hemipterigena]
MADTEWEWDDPPDETYNSDPDEIYSSPQVDTNSTFYRLRWQVRDGPIWENIRVLEDGCKADSTQRPFQNETGRLHEISSLPFSVNPVQAIIVTIQGLNGMQDWKEKDGSWSPRRQDRDSMPRVRVSASEGRDFVSIGDYVMAVNKLLVSQRSKILKERGLLDDGVEWPPDTELWVDPTSANEINFFNTRQHQLEDEWEELAVFTSVQQYSESIRHGSDKREEYVPVYPATLKSDEEFAALAGAWSSLAFLRLRWKVCDGPVSENITVLKDVFDPYSSESPFQDESGNYHEIASLPFSRPPRPHLEITIDQVDGLEGWKCDGVDDRWSPERNDPSSAPRLDITAGEGRDFISIGDYISQTYEWLAALRPKILKEVGLNTDEREWEPDTELWLDPRFPENISFVQNREGTAWKDWQQIAQKASQG